MTERIVEALILAAGAFMGAFLGSVVRPLLEHFLQQKALRKAESRDVLRTQLDQVYGPIYDLLQDSIPPGEPLTEIDPDAIDEIVKIARAKRKLTYPKLEEIVGYIEEAIYLGSGAIDNRELVPLWQHVKDTYNRLRKMLGLPHDPHWAKLPLGELYKRIKSWLTLYMWELERRKRRRRARKKS